MKTFVLVHCAFGSPAELSPVILELKALGHRAIAVDLPCTDPSATLDDYARTVVEAMAGFVVGSEEAGRSFLPWSTLVADTVLRGPAALEESAPALILFTSGSTGHPKGVTHSHCSAWHAIDNSREAVDIRADDVVLVGKPISQPGGLHTQFLPTLMVGGQVILSMKPTPESASELIVREGVSQYGMLESDLLDFVE
jgi:acyl-coenzyme A synthetase/AMP-(fatty) acid ligase